MAGRGSLAGLLPYGDANGVVVEMSGEVLPIVKDVPVLAGVCGTDPFRSMPVFLDQLQRLGFSGVQNFPTVGLYDGLFRQNLEETGMGFSLEVEMIRLAHERGLATAPYVFDADQARAMAQAGADVLVAHVGLTAKGTIGAATTMAIDEAAVRIQAMHDAAKAVRSNILVLCHGGPLATPDDVTQLLSMTQGIAGFFGASSVERLPTEIAIEAQVRSFKNVLSGTQS
jgi:predicted TIM-barrel enzyme